MTPSQEEAKRCEYKFKDFKCKEPIDPGQEYCTLHLEFPNDDPESEEFKRIQGLKYAKVKEKKKNKDYAFAGARLKNIVFSGDEIDLTIRAGYSPPLDFRDAHIRNNAYFIGAKIKNGNILFTSAHIAGELTFAEAEINGGIWLADSEIGMPSFRKANIQGNIHLDNAIINHEISFDDATIRGNIYFRRCKINDIISLNFEKLKGELIFDGTSFEYSWSQEIACRKARRIYEDMGDKIKADDYFYREMEAKRQQKGLIKAEEGSFKKGNLDFIKRFFWYDLIEYALMQKVFGYGVHPIRLIASWILIIPIFAFMYWKVEGMNGGLFGIQNYIEGSLATAIAPGYIAVVINNTVHTTTIYHLLAVLETIIGTFLWAGFIATFARRYTR